MKPIIPFRVTNPHAPGTLCAIARRSKTPGATFHRDYNFRLTQVVAGDRWLIIETPQGLMAGGLSLGREHPERTFRAYALPRGFRARDAWKAWEAAGSPVWRHWAAARVWLEPFRDRGRE